MVNSRLQVENVKRNLIVLEFFVFPSVSRVEMRWYTEQLATAISHATLLLREILNSNLNEMIFNPTY